MLKSVAVLVLLFFREGGYLIKRYSKPSEIAAATMSFNGMRLKAMQELHGRSCARLMKETGTKVTIKTALTGLDNLRLTTDLP